MRAITISVAVGALAIYLALVLLTGNPAPPAALQAKLQEVETLYRTGDYQDAIAICEQALQQGWSSGAIHYNVGDCYYKIEEYGRAILHYERARRFWGDDPDLIANLQLANMRIADRVTPLPRFFVIRFFEAMGGILSVRGWAILFIVTLWALLFCLIALYYVNKPSVRRGFAYLLVTLCLALVLAGIFFTHQKVQQDRRLEAIVLARQASVLSAPENESTELFALHEGTKVRILRHISGWAEIQLADGKQGWMLETEFKEI
ncbi:MAG: tetratricopeptide repeat protein [bacterium]